MKKRDFHTVEYENLYVFVMQSESEQDFLERTQIISCVIINELARRLSIVHALFPIQLVEPIDQMNEEVMCLTNNINSANIIENQPPIIDPLLLRLMQVNNAKLFHDYIHAKSILPN